VVVGEVVGSGGVGWLGCHKEGLVEIGAMGVIREGVVAAVRLGKEAPAIIIVAGGGGQRRIIVVVDSLDAGETGVLQVQEGRPRKMRGASGVARGLTLGEWGIL